MSDLANISLEAAVEKSKLGTRFPWLALAKIVWPDGTILRLVRNTDDVQFDCGDGEGVQNYLAMGWEFDELQETADGSIPQWSVSVSNVSRMVESMLEEYSGGVGGSVTIYVVNAAQLQREPDIELSFDIVGSSSDVRFARFKLGAQSPFRIIFGRHTYTSDVCRFRYKSAQCGYTGSMPSCSFRLNDVNGCRAHQNAKRFGGYPGVDSNGLRVISK